MMLKPVRYDDIRKLKGEERDEALRRYHQWLKEQRKEDRRIEGNLQNKLWRFKNREKFREIQKKWYQKSKAYLREYRQRPEVRKRQKTYMKKYYYKKKNETAKR